MLSSVGMETNAVVIVCDALVFMGRVKHKHLKLLQTKARLLESQPSVELWAAGVTGIVLVARRTSVA